MFPKHFAKGNGWVYRPFRTDKLVKNDKPKDRVHCCSDPWVTLSERKNDAFHKKCQFERFCAFILLRSCSTASEMMVQDGESENQGEFVFNGLFSIAMLNQQMVFRKNTVYLILVCSFSHVLIFSIFIYIYMAGWTHSSFFSGLNHQLGRNWEGRSRGSLFLGETR